MADMMQELMCGEPARGVISRVQRIHQCLFSEPFRRPIFGLHTVTCAYRRELALVTQF